MRKKKETKTEVINPFDKGVTYEVFLQALGKEKIENYLEGVCEESQIEWIKTELLNFKNK